MNRNLSKHDRINAVLAGHKVEELKARHAYLHGLGMGREEYGTFWLRSDNSTFGHGFGRMMGWKELVPAHFGAPVSTNPFGPPPESMGMPDIEGDNPMFRKYKPRDDRPTKAADIFGELNLYGHNDHGTFSQSCHVLGSPVIEVADDGKSARSFYLTPGTMMGVNGDQGGRNGGFLWERYGSDFVFRDGRWWWFHEQVCPDILGSLDDGNWAQDRFRQYLAGTLKVDSASSAPRSGISDLRAAHKEVSIVQTVQDTVPVPKPYEKLDEEHTYSPGCSDFSGYIYPSTQGYGNYLY
jgi:hypothetical protein